MVTINEISTIILNKFIRKKYKWSNFSATDNEKLNSINEDKIKVFFERAF